MAIANGSTGEANALIMELRMQLLTLRTAAYDIEARKRQAEIHRLTGMAEHLDTLEGELQAAYDSAKPLLVRLYQIINADNGHEEEPT